MRPSTQSAASSSLRQLATCSAVNTSGTCSNIGESKTETRAQHRGTSWSRHDVTAADAIEVILVRQVIEIELQVDVTCKRIRRHRVKRPISLDHARVDGVAEASVDKTRAAAEVKTVMK